MKIQRKHILAGLVVLSFAASIVFYPFLPERVPSHWGISGEVDAYSSKAFGVFFPPILLLAIVFLLFFLPKIDPMKENIQKVKKYYENLAIILAVFFIFLQFFIILWGLGIVINPAIILPMIIAPVLFYAGVVCGKAERNWTIGVKTPWTLSDDEIWRKTNGLAGRLFKVCGIISLIGAFLPKYSFFLIIIPVLFSAVFVIVYSYIIYSQKKRI